MNRRSVIAPFVAVVAAVAAGWCAVLLVRDRLPERLVTHWGLDGQPDGWQARTPALWFAVGFTLGTGTLLHLLGVAMRHPRALGPVAAGTSWFLAPLLFGSIVLQAGGDSPAIGPLLLVSLVVGLVAGGLVHLAAPEASPPAVAALPEGVVTYEAPAGARIAWVGRTARARHLPLVAAVTFGPVVVLAAWLALVGNWWVAAFLLVVAGLAGLLGTTMLSTVTIDHRGLRAVACGVPWLRAPLSNLESATVTVPDLMGEFGGWGLRAGSDGSWGLITATAPAVRVKRAGRGDLVVTVDDAEGAAAVLNTLIERRDLR